MFEFETSMSRPSAYELHRRARREQAEFVNTLMGNAARKLAGWVGALARNGAKLARALAAERQLRRATWWRAGSSEIARSATWA